MLVVYLLYVCMFVVRLYVCGTFVCLWYVCMFVVRLYVCGTFVCLWYVCMFVVRLFVCLFNVYRSIVFKHAVL